MSQKITTLYQYDSQVHSGWLMARLREAFFIVSLGLTLLMCLALLTYHPRDVAWSTWFSLPSPVQNAGGQFGALLSDILLCAFGATAYLLPFLCLKVGLHVYYPRLPKLARWPVRLLSSLAFPIWILSCSTLLYAYIRPFPWTLPMGNGGFLGQTLYLYFLPYLGYYGSLVMWLSLQLATITLLSGLSWLGLFHQLRVEVMDRLPILLKKIYSSLKKNKHSTRLSRPKPVVNCIHVDETPATVSPIRTQQETNQALQLPLTLLTDLSAVEHPHSESQTLLDEKARILEGALAEFGLEARVLSIKTGPVISQFEVMPAKGVKSSRIVMLEKDLARVLSVPTLRVVEILKDSAGVGIEIPNLHRKKIGLRALFSHEAYVMAEPLNIVIAEDQAGEPLFMDLRKMPHLLMAGTTGSGKSVAMNALLLSLLYKCSASTLRLVLIDPKMLELSVYADIPHLLFPVITDMTEAEKALKWCVLEMERRYQLLSEQGTRQLESYNQVAEEPLPYIVIMIDEFADMMMVVGKKVEEHVMRLSQKARAAGIHLILATQRPSVDVVTGLIKANVPSRLAFQVASKIDSRTILDQGGAEQLLGQGDMLYLPVGSQMPIRAQAAFVSDDEVHRVVEALKTTGKPDYALSSTVLSSSEFSLLSDQDPLFDEAVSFVIQQGKASVSGLQRRFKIGYNRAARLMDSLAQQQIVSEAQTGGYRTVLVSKSPQHD